MSAVTELMRGDVPKFSAMEILQVGYLHSVAAAAGCTLASPTPDRGVDWILTHASQAHTTDSEATLKIALKSTSQLAPNPPGEHFPFRLENEHLRKLSQSPVTVPRILVVMIVPRSMDDWIIANPDCLSVSHCSYWVNLEGVQGTGKSSTTVQVPTSNVFDHVALCGIMARIGSGGNV